MTTGELARARALYEEQELTIRQVCAELGRSYATVQGSLKRAGVRMRGRARPVDAAQVLRLYRDLSLEQTARRLGVQRARVRRVLVDAGVRIRPGRRARLDLSQLRRAARMRDVRGMKQTEIAPEVGVAANTLSVALRRAGFGRAPRAARRMADGEVAALRRLRAQGVSLRGIAARTGWSLPTVHKHTRGERRGVAGTS